MTRTRRFGVMMLTPSFYPHVGGAEKQALELSKALAARGLSVLVLTRQVGDLPASASVSGIPVRRLAAWGTGLVNSLVFLASSFLHILLHGRDYRAIHVHLAGSPALAALLAGRLTGKTVVIKVGGGRGIGEIAASRKTAAGRLKLLLFRLLRPRFVAVTADLIAELGEAGLGAGARVVPNGVDTRRYKPLPAPEREKLRASLGWPEGQAFLYVGRFSAEKRLDHFLRVFAAAGRETAGKAFAVLVGAGPLEADLRALIAELKLKDRAFLLPPEDQIWRVYAAADVFVLPSISEGLSNSVLEAMATGLAVLASRSGGTPELVAEGTSGLLFDPLDEGELRSQLVKFLKNPALASKMGAAGRAAAASGFAIEKVAQRYLEIYGFAD